MGIKYKIYFAIKGNKNRDIDTIYIDRPGRTLTLAIHDVIKNGVCSEKDILRIEKQLPGVTYV